MRLRVDAPLMQMFYLVPNKFNLQEGASTMKHFDLFMLVRAGMLALCLGMLPSAMSAYAQTNSNSTTTNANTTRTVVGEDNDTDWG